MLFFLNLFLQIFALVVAKKALREASKIFISSQIRKITGCLCFTGLLICYIFKPAQYKFFSRLKIFLEKFLIGFESRLQGLQYALSLGPFKQLCLLPGTDLGGRGGGGLADAFPLRDSTPCRPKVSPLW